jgi:hypothetical protein
VSVPPPLRQGQTFSRLGYPLCGVKLDAGDFWLIPKGISLIRPPRAEKTPKNSVCPPLRGARLGLMGSIILFLWFKMISTLTQLIPMVFVHPIEWTLAQMAKLRKSAENVQVGLQNPARYTFLVSRSLTYA